MTDVLSPAAHPSLQSIADANQAKASDPQASVWVSANAGTGKTEVLVRRVLRLLLAGSRPECILCLTYTKAAAAEMQNRLLATLAGWTMADEASLSGRLQAMIGRPPREPELERARRLFASTLEARGGLKIHTIHGFCERLLQRFPLEAGVVPHFTILDESGESELRNAALNQVLGKAASVRDSRLGRALSRIVLLAGEEQFRGVIQAAMAKRRELQALQDLHGQPEHWAELECTALRALFGIDAALCEADLEAALDEVLPPDLAEDLLDALGRFGTTGDDERLRACLKQFETAEAGTRASILRKIFCQSDGKKLRLRLLGKPMKDGAPELAARLDQARERYANIDSDLGKVTCAEASAALLTLAEAVQGAYSRSKQAQAALDYADLIEKTLQLLRRRMAAAWVLFKIDGGVDHILVDEAQDTNPEQWEIIETLAEEFFAGAGVASWPRTLFAVGDEKQSIYSFQGADPAQFGSHGRRFAARARAAEQDWHDVPLTLSFRSTEPVLKAVDAVFARPEAAKGLSGEELSLIQHHAFRQGQAGLVELWDPEVQEKADPSPAFEPWNEAKGNRQAVEALTERIARTIRAWLDTGALLASQGRPIRAGDILILVQRRAPLVTPLVRWLKRLNVPVAGVDRMMLTEQLAVQDLLSLADFLLMPEDDLALATVLKSPLFGLDEDDLFALAWRREGSLWRALQAHSAEASFADAAAKLDAWLGRADFLPPYEFFAEVLGADDQTMRKRFLTRLGPEAAEALDEMMELALRYDAEAAPSLQGFVHQLRAGNLEIKRDMEQARDEVRIMTVHGAKGLQAPIVFLPDTCRVPQNKESVLLAHRTSRDPLQPPHLIWAKGAREIEPIEAAKALRKDAMIEEYHRLLYVAMTRARDRLYVCGWATKKNEEEGCWYQLIKDGLSGLLTEVELAEGVTVRRLDSPNAPEHKPQPAEVAGEQPVAEALPGWARLVPLTERMAVPLRPSRIPLGGEDMKTIEPAPLGPRLLAENDRFLRGRLIHALLQHLPGVPAAERQAAAKRFLKSKAEGLPEANRAALAIDALAAEALAIVEHADFAPLFGPGSLSEVPVVARIGAGENAYDLSGQIDRLAILEDDLLVLDYKTNRPPPAEIGQVAPAYIAQLAAYHLALSAMFPGKNIRAALLWTDGPRLMEIPPGLIEQAARKLLQGSRS